MPQLRTPDWFKEGDIIYCFLEEKNAFRRGKVIEVKDNCKIKIKINNSYKEISIYEPTLLRPEDFFWLINDAIHLRGWLGSCKEHSKEFKENFEEAIQKEREKILSFP